jgi:hypothetical protein
MQHLTLKPSSRRLARVVVVTPVPVWVVETEVEKVTTCVPEEVVLEKVADGAGLV